MRLTFPDSGHEYLYARPDRRTENKAFCLQNPSALPATNGIKVVRLIYSSSACREGGGACCDRRSSSHSLTLNHSIEPEILAQQVRANLRVRRSESDRGLGRNKGSGQGRREMFLQPCKVVRARDRLMRGAWSNRRSTPQPTELDTNGQETIADNYHIMVRFAIMWLTFETEFVSSVKFGALVTP